MRDIDMSTKYDPTAVEAGRYDHWQEKKLFAPESNQAIQAWLDSGANNFFSCQWS